MRENKIIIKLHAIDSTELYLNADTITKIYQRDWGSEVHVMDEAAKKPEWTPFQVTEDPETIDKMLAEAYRDAKAGKTNSLFTVLTAPEEPQERTE